MGTFDGGQIIIVLVVFFMRDTGHRIRNYFNVIIKL